jgi:hypothetical protein
VPDAELAEGRLQVHVAAANDDPDLPASDTTPEVQQSAISALGRRAQPAGYPYLRG